MRSMFERSFVMPAVWESFRRLAPQDQWRNPVMFVCYIGAIFTTLLFFQALFGKGEAPAGYIVAVSVWLWITVLFANFAEAIAEGRGKAQAAALRAHAPGHHGEEADRAAPRRARARWSRRRTLQQGRHRAGRGRRHDPARRRGDRGRRLGERVRRSPANRRR